MLDGVTAGFMEKLYMDDNELTDERQEITLLDSLQQGDWLKLPCTIMADVGPAVQTLGGLLKLTSKEIFRPMSDIAEAARVPLGTARKHVVTLHEQGWIENQGRQKTRGGRLRRTATVKITKQTRERLEPYGILPWWAAHNNRKGKIPWSAKAVLAIIMARLCSLKAAAVQEDIAPQFPPTPDDCDCEPDCDCDNYPECDCEAVCTCNERYREECEEAIENLGGEDRFRFSLTDLSRQTGLDHKSVVKAKRWLKGAGILDWMGNGERADLLAPNWNFRVIQTAASPGHVWLDFTTKRGKQSVPQG